MRALYLNLTITLYKMKNLIINLQKSALSDYGAGVSTVENLCRMVIPRDLLPYLR